MRGRAGRTDVLLGRDEQLTQALLGGPAGPDGQRKQSASVLRLLGLAREEACILVFATIFLLLSSLATVAVPKLVGQLIDTCIQFDKHSAASEADAKRTLNWILYQILGLLAVGGVATGLRSWMFNSAAERVMWRVRKRLFRRLTQQEIGFFDCVRTGELMNRLSEDTRLMKTAGTISISVALRSTVVAALGLVLMFLTSAVLTGLTLAILPLLLLALRLYSGLNKRYTREGLSCSAEASTVAEEVFGSIRTVRAFAKEGACCARYEACQDRVLGWGLRSCVAGSFFFAYNYVFATGALVVVLWFGARQVLEKGMSPGDLSTFVIYALYVGTNTGAVGNVISQLIQAVGASERVFQLLDREPRLPPAGGLRPQGSPEGGRVELKDVWFSYPSRPDAEVLRGISLHVPPGKKVALVGQSGGGKSTIVNLIQRFYDPQAGQVLLDGADISHIDHAFLHAQVSIVSQEPVLFADSLYFNIAFGLPRGEADATLAQVEEAAKLANAHDFISQFPLGYRTPVGERGVRLSGGQKQRIAIARAVLTRPRVLLLDEATSALDAESEALVQEALDRVARGRTVLTIAHRLSTVQSAAEVAVIQGGVVAESGAHEELLARGGVYAALVRRQLQQPGRLAGSRSPSLDALGEAEPARSRMSRQSTGAIVDEVMASIIGVASGMVGRSAGRQRASGGVAEGEGEGEGEAEAEREASENGSQPAEKRP